MSTTIAKNLAAIQKELPEVTYDAGEDPKAFLDEIRQNSIDAPRADTIDSGVDRTALRHAVSNLYSYASLPGAREAFSAAAEMVNVASTQDFIGSLEELGAQYPTTPAIGIQELKDLSNTNRFNGPSTAYKDAVQAFVAQHTRPGTALEARLTHALVGNDGKPSWRAKVLTDLVSGDASRVSIRNNMRLSAERGDAGPLDPSVVAKAEQWTGQTEAISKGDPDPYDTFARRDPTPLNELKSHIIEAVSTWDEAMRGVNSAIVYEGVEGLMASTGVVEAFEQDLFNHAYQKSSSNPIAIADLYKEVADLKRQLDPIADAQHWDRNTRPMWAEALDNVHAYLANQFAGALAGKLHEAKREPDLVGNFFSPRENAAKVRDELRDVWHAVRGSDLELSASKAYGEARLIAR